jgi:glutamate racemase
MNPPAPASARAVCIGVFDSGVGGLSVLRSLHALMPDARFLYVADSGHAPYGERDEAYVVERARSLTAHLLAEGAQMVVVACNTATAAAVQALRERWPAVGFVGVEPGLKPAIALSRNGRIGVMATRGTLQSAKFRRLVETHAAGVELRLQPCDGLARALEEGDADAPAVRALVERHAAPLREAGVDTVVLGCTHYPFAAPQIAAALGPEVALVDTAEAVALQARRLAAGLPPGAGGPDLLWTSGEPAVLQRVARRWLGWAGEARALPETAAAWCPESGSNRYGP